MNICFVTIRTTFSSFGGLEVHARDLIEGLSKMNHRVIVISSFHPDNISHLKVNDNLEYYFVSQINDKNRNHFFSLSGLFFRKLNIKEKFDCIISEADSAIGIIKYNKSTPKLYVIHHGHFRDEALTRFKREDLKGKFSAILYYIKFMLDRYQTILLKKCTGLITINTHLLDYFKMRYPFVRNKISLIYNGIDIQRFKPLRSEEIKESIKFLVNSDHVLLFTGRIEQEKGIQKIIQILHMLRKTYPDLILCITGDGLYKNELIKLAKNNHVEDSIVYLGKVPYEDLVYYYNLCSLFVFPTLRFEGLPYNICEAMACGCVVISSNIGGTARMIEDRITGFLINPHKPEELAKKILFSLSNPSICEEIKINARNFAIKNFSIDRMIQKYNDLFVSSTKEKKLEK